MNRRGFLAALAGAVLDPERLLWRPGAKLISIPAPVKPWVGIDYAWGDPVTYEEHWRKFQGKVYRQIGGFPPELTPFREIPFASLKSPMPDYISLVGTMPYNEFRRRYP